MDVLQPAILIRAYTMGIFPMGDDDGEIRWYCPDPRCIFELDTFVASKRLARRQRKGTFEIRINSAFDQVMRACAERDTTWITEPIIEAYNNLNRLGLAHSVEAWKDNELVGGLYGVSVGGAFMGESMFHTVTDASKICLVALIDRLRERDFVLLDCQYMTSHLRSLGAVLISRDEYLQRLSVAVGKKVQFD